MASFTDAVGRTWNIEFDGPLMGEVRDKAKVDLADLSGIGYLKLETDAPSLVAALKILCRESIAAVGLTPEQFAKSIRKDALSDAAAAVIAAAADFFPTKTWSEVRSRCESARKTRSEFAALIPLMAILEEPGVPERLKNAVMTVVTTHLQAAESGANGAGGVG